MKKIFNDKEPVGSTRGILEVIKKNELDNTLIIIVRYFGGYCLEVDLLQEHTLKLLHY
jgi:putative IMPACT (imprinted ancient) family translation regulator